jgi:hypothetical protein
VGLLLVLTDPEGLSAKIIVAEDEESIESVGTVLPKDLGTFHVQRVLRTSTISDVEHAALAKRRAEERMQFDQSILTIPTAVDEVTYSKGGITSVIEYDKPSYFGTSR